MEVGENADLVLLAGNPVTDAVHLAQVVGFVRLGRHYSARDLEQIKDRARTINPAR